MLRWLAERLAHLAKVRARWHAPIGDRRTKDQRTPVERDHNRLQAGLRALVEQAIEHLANAWTLRRWRGLLYRDRGDRPDRVGGAGRAARAAGIG